jgi:hypothetical protein
MRIPGHDIRCGRGIRLNLPRRIFFAADDLGDFEERAVGIRGVLQDFFDRQARLDDIFAEDVVDGRAWAIGSTPVTSTSLILAMYWRIDPS